MKAVISSTGFVVGKNYDPQHLQTGDIGLSVRIDRNGVEELSPSQQTAAVSVGTEMNRELVEQLGGDAGTTGFRTGMIVGHDDENGNTTNGVVEAITEGGLTLKILDDNGKWVLRHVPYTLGIIEESSDFKDATDLIINRLPEMDEKLRASLAAQVPAERVTKIVLEATKDSHALHALPGWIIDRLDKEPAVLDAVSKYLLDSNDLLALGSLVELPLSDRTKQTIIKLVDVEGFCRPFVINSFCSGAISADLAVGWMEGCDANWPSELYEAYQKVHASNRADNVCVPLILYHITDQKVLKIIIYTSRNPEEVGAAARKVDDQQLLRLALQRDFRGDERVYLRGVIKLLTDQALLADFAMNTNWSEGQLDAIELLTDQAMLAEITAMTDADLALAALAKIPDDSPVIAERAQEHPHFKVREEATKRVHDQKVLAKIAKTDPEEEVRRAAVENLTDQNTLFAIAAKRGELDLIRVRATYKLEPEASQRLLASELKAPKPSHQLVCTLLRQDTTSVTLATILTIIDKFRTTVDGVFDGLPRAIRSLPENDLIALLNCNEIANDPLRTLTYCADALAKLGRDDLLIEHYATMSKRGEHAAQIRLIAHIGDQAFLDKIARNENEPDAVRETTVRLVKDLARFKALAIELPNSFTMQALAYMKFDQITLFEIARSAKDERTAAQAAQGITDQHFLRKLDELPESRPNSPLGKVVAEKLRRY